MTRRRIRVSSRALGEREYLKVWVYESLDDMRADAAAFNGNPHSQGLGVTQCWADQSGRATSVLIRLWRGALSAEILSHEVHHAATAIYGAHQADRISRVDHLNHFNEPFAYLFSDLLGRLHGRLDALGYYE